MQDLKCAEVAEEPELEVATKKRRTNIGPWRNKQEFQQVYVWIFGPDSSNETKRNACKRMTIWKMRRLNFTPASVLSTLVILEVQLKDKEYSSSKQILNELQILYASAFTRFLNHMSSIMQTGRMKTMYQTAMELGIEAFIVDLRHLCAHGQVMPSIDVLRRAAEYCINWLKEFYWDHEMHNQMNIDAKNVRKNDITVFDDNVTELLQIYDASAHGEYKGCENVNETRKILNEENFNCLKKYCNVNQEFRLHSISEMVIKELEAIVKREPGIKHSSLIFIEAFMKMNFIFEMAANVWNDREDAVMVIQINRYLFRSIALQGFIEELFYQLITICENNFESMFKRKGASFWANEIVLGFTAFNKFKLFCKTEKEKNPDFKIETKMMSKQPNLPKSVKKIYKDLNIDIDGALIFGDHFKHPLSLSFTKNYIEERIKTTNEYTKEVLKNCVCLVYPSLSSEKIDNLKAIINIYCSESPEIVEDTKINIDAPKEDKIYQLGTDVLNAELGDTEMTDLDVYPEEKKFGIWSTTPDGQDWHCCPLGRLVWE